MSVADRLEPVRSCIGCRQRRPQSDLVRITWSDTGVVADGASVGRGAWLCRGLVGGDLVVAGCLDAAVSRRAFARAWKREIGVVDEEAIRECVGRRADGDEHPDAH